MRLWAIGCAATLLLCAGSASAEEDGPYDGLDNSPIFIAGVVLDFAAFGVGLPVIVDVAEHGSGGFFDKPELVVPGAIAAASFAVGVPLTIAGAVQCPPPAAAPKKAPAEASLLLGPGQATLKVRF